MPPRIEIPRPRLRRPLARTQAEAPPSWYRIKAADDDDDVTVIDIYDEIGGWWFGIDAADFIRELREITTARIELHINSPGGDVFDGVAIYNALLDHSARVEVQVDALAASIASVIAMAGDEIVMTKPATMMIHDAWGMAIGNAADMREMADLLDKLSNTIAEVYADRAGGEVDEWRDRMLAESWFNASEAVEVGLADRVLDRKADDAADSKAKARWDLSVFRYAGRDAAPAPSLAIAAKVTEPPPEPPVDDVDGSQAHELVGFDADTLRDAIHRGVEEPFEWDADHFRNVVDLFSREAPAVTVEPDPDPDPAVSLGTTVGKAVADIVRQRSSV